MLLSKQSGRPEYEQSFVRKQEGLKLRGVPERGCVHEIRF